MEMASYSLHGAQVPYIQHVLVLVSQALKQEFGQWIKDFFSL